MGENFGSRRFFTEVVTTDQLLGLSAGYELEQFRNHRLADLMFAALPEFALNYSELETIDPTNMMERLREAAGTIYRSEKFKNRGEFGELLLHLVMRDFFKTIPAISKVYFKDSANTTVKGFDAVHVVEAGEELELWLGETKFYLSISSAISEVIKELRAHTTAQFLRDEFLFIQRKVDPNWKFAAKLRELTNKNIPIQKIFRSLKIPVLLTYESGTVAAHKDETVEFLSDMKIELEKHHLTFREKDLPQNVTVVLILVPLHQKNALVSILDQKLKGLQAI